MRRGLLALVAGFGFFSSGIVARAQTAFFNSVRPDASVVIKKHSMGADLVELTILGSQYPEDEVRTKIQSLGMILNNNPRGVVVAPTDTFVKASFAVNGLINDTEPRLNLVAIAQAFSFGQKPLKNVSVFFENVVPSKEIPARWFPEDESWKLEGMAVGQPKGIEYRFAVKTNDPKMINLPGSKEAQKVKEIAAQKQGPDFLLIGALFVGAIAVGLLVYSALIRPRQRQS